MSCTKSLLPRFSSRPGVYKACSAWKIWVLKHGIFSVFQCSSGCRGSVIIKVKLLKLLIFGIYVWGKTLKNSYCHTTRCHAATLRFIGETLHVFSWKFSCCMRSIEIQTMVFFMCSMLTDMVTYFYWIEILFTIKSNWCVYGYYCSLPFN